MIQVVLRNYYLNNGIIVRREDFGAIIFSPSEELTIRVDKKGFQLLNEIFNENRLEDNRLNKADKQFLLNLIKYGVLKKQPIKRGKKPRLYQRLEQDIHCLSFPESLHLSITNACNLSCKSCYNSEKKKDEYISFGLFKKIIEEAYQEGIFQIAIGGGEPFCHPKIWDFLRELNLKGIKTNITSNGTLLGKKEIERLESFENIGRIQISLDGTNRRIHGYSREKFDKVMDSITKLSSSNLKVGINFLLRNSNINNLLEMYRFCQKNRIKTLNLLRIKPPIKDREWFYKEKLNQKSLNTLYGFLNNSKKVGNIEIYLDASMSYFFQNTDSYKLRINGCLGCSAGINFLTVLPNGHIQACTHLKYKIGSVEEGIKKIWLNSKILKLLRSKKMWVKDPCKSCWILPYCGGCRAIAIEEFGKINEKDLECQLFKRMKLNMNSLR